VIRRSDSAETARHAFRPHPLLRNGHAMTVAGVKLPRFQRRFLADEQRFEVRVDDTTTIVAEANWQPGDAPVAVLVHGLSGSAKAVYVVGAARKAWTAGFSTVRINLRTCGGTESLSSSLYHAGLSDDLEALVDWIARERRPAWIGVAGFSLGGGIVLHAAARWGAAPPPGVARLWVQSAPFDLEQTSAAMHRGGFNRVYVQYFLDDFRRSWRRKAGLYPERYPRDGLRGIRSVRAFDDRWTAPSFGWPDAAAYYRDASPTQVLERVRVPGTVLHAEDDPFVPMCPEANRILERHPSLAYLETRHGGHNAFVAARPVRTSRWRDLDRYWGENRMAEEFARSAGLAPAG